jgi:hypothetical protein
MIVPEKSKRKSENLRVTLGSSLVTPAGYLQLLRVSDAYSECSYDAVQSSWGLGEHLLWIQRPSGGAC